MLSRDTLRKTLKWLAVILMIAGAAGGGYGYWMWTHCDEFLLHALLRKQKELAPDWDMQIGRAHFDWYRRVHVYDVKIKVRGHRETILTLPEVVIAIDRDKFQRDQSFEIESVRVINPLAELSRDAAGDWNWHALLTLKLSDRSLPEWFIEQGRIKVRYEQADNSPPTVLTLEQADLKLIPSGRRQFAVLGQADFNNTGSLNFRGDWNVDAHQWSLDGELSEIQRSGELLQIAAGTSDKLRRRLARFGEHLERTRMALTEPEGTRIAAREDADLSLPPPPEASSSDTSALPDFGLESPLDVKFHVAQSSRDAEWQYRTLIDWKQGTLSHPVLPFPLRGLTGQVYCDNRHIEFRNLTAQNGMTRISLSGKVRRGRPQSRGQLNLAVTNLLFDRRLRSRLPMAWRAQYDTVQPSGFADVSLVLHHDADAGWQPQDFVLTARGGGLINQEFPYPLSDITGTMKQRGEDLVVDLIGEAGGRKVEIQGEIKQPGPEAETRFTILVRQFPLDDRFRQACTPEVQEVLRQTNLSGWADARILLYRPPGADQDLTARLAVRLTNCEIQLEAFPYHVTNLSGDVTYHSEEKNWTFQNIRGEHGTAVLTAAGNFQQAVAPGVLNMKIHTQGAAFDESLYRALPENMKTVWTNFSPSGKVDAVSKIRWVPHMGFEWSLPEAVIYNGRMKLKAFPYSLSEIRAKVSFEDSLCEIKSFTAKHDDARFRGRGRAHLPTQGRWTLDLSEVFVDDLSPDRQFRQALPSGLRTVVEELDPQKPFSLSGGVRLSGTDRETDPIVASWDLKFIFTGNQLNTGVQLKNLHGQIGARGTWDGRQAHTAGQIQLESVEVLDYQLTKVTGPYRIEGNRVTIGSPHILDPSAENRAVPFEQRLTAQAIDGTLTYDAEVFLEQDVRYRSRLTLINGRLEEYARRYLPGTRNLSGVMNGWLNISGRGVETNRMSGSGQLRISPAALYELPILARVFQVLSLAGPDRTAFRFAFVDFDLANNQFVFKNIDLTGESISLRGLGSASFDGRLNIDFYSLLPRARLPWPVASLVNPVLDQATKDWVRVEVRGKTSRPDVTLKPVPVIEESIKRFLGILGTGMPNERQPLSFRRRR